MTSKDAQQLVQEYKVKRTHNHWHISITLQPPVSRVTPPNPRTARSMSEPIPQALPSALDKVLVEFIFPIWTNAQPDRITKMAEVIWPLIPKVQQAAFEQFSRSPIFLQEFLIRACRYVIQRARPQTGNGSLTSSRPTQLNPTLLPGASSFSILQSQHSSYGPTPQELPARRQAPQTRMPSSGSRRKVAMPHRPTDVPSSFIGTSHRSNVEAPSIDFQVPHASVSSSDISVASSAVPSGSNLRLSSPVPPPYTYHPGQHENLSREQIHDPILNAPARTEADQDFSAYWDAINASLYSNAANAQDIQPISDQSQSVSSVTQSSATNTVPAAVSTNASPAQASASAPVTVTPVPVPATIYPVPLSATAPTSRSTSTPLSDAPAFPGLFIPSAPSRSTTPSHTSHPVVHPQFLAFPTRIIHQGSIPQTAILGAQNQQNFPWVQQFQEPQAARVSMNRSPNAFAIPGTPSSLEPQNARKRRLSDNDSPHEPDGGK
ncbi:hypothetical protein D9756_000930 [Leucocoprinus leucothites]|uniref:Uncharacterized protein n=1 Tax=Leucocoprinus leucothites TaxID=201217 RepID=A0A8H5LNX5_9AGAR|nr:hypothetical protein D9756_000930 [Leucoagaricus leucothites]